MVSGGLQVLLFNWSCATSPVDTETADSLGIFVKVLICFCSRATAAEPKTLLPWLQPLAQRHGPLAAAAAAAAAVAAMHDRHGHRVAAGATVACHHRGGSRRGARPPRRVRRAAPLLCRLGGLRRLRPLRRRLLALTWPKVRAFRSDSHTYFIPVPLLHPLDLLTLTLDL